jgi:hypothetical protein
MQIRQPFIDPARGSGRRVDKWPIELLIIGWHQDPGGIQCLQLRQLGVLARRRAEARRPHPGEQFLAQVGRARCGHRLTSWGWRDQRSIASILVTRCDKRRPE